MKSVVVNLGSSGRICSQDADSKIALGGKDVMRLRRGTFWLDGRKGGGERQDDRE